jgi:hypothetical protein
MIFDPADLDGLESVIMATTYPAIPEGCILRFSVLKTK